MVRCSTRVTKLGLRLWSRTPWVRLLQQWLKKSENLIVWSDWRCLQLDGQWLLLPKSAFNSSILKEIQKLVLKLLKYVFFSSFGHLVKDILTHFNSLWSFSFYHIVRQGNVIAHALSQKARLSFSLLVWIEDVPPNVYAFVSEDFSAS